MINVKEIFKKTFLDVYRPDGVDPLQRVEDLDEEYTLKISTIFSFLFGLPNRNLGLSAAKNLLYNFIGWQDDVTAARKIINAVLMPVMIALNLIALPAKSLINIAKFFTEFLPAALFEIGLQCIEVFDNLKSGNGDRVNKLVAGLLVVPMLALVSMMLIFLILKSISRAITSPITSVKIAWNIHKLNKFQRGTLAALSTIITFTVYAVFFPLAAFIAGAVIPFVASHLPVAIVNAISVISQAVAPILTVIANAAIIPVVTVILDMLFLPASMVTSLTSFISTAPAVTGLGAFSAIFITTFGRSVTKLTDKFRNWWHDSARVTATRDEQEKPEAIISLPISSHTPSSPSEDRSCCWKLFAKSPTSRNIENNPSGPQLQP
jgi:hypothetical protein